MLRQDIASFGLAGTALYADESETNTEQELGQRNVCSGFAVCTNHGQNSIHTQGNPYYNEPQSSDSKENKEQKGSISDTNNSYSDKLREVKKPREKRIEGVKDRLEGLGIQWNPHAILSQDYNSGFHTLLYCIPPKPYTSVSFYRANLNGVYMIYFCNLIIIFCTEDNKHETIGLDYSS